MQCDFDLQALRHAKGLTQKQVAAALKINPATYAAIEAGRRKPSIDVLCYLAVLYDTSMDYAYNAYYRKRVEYHYPDGQLKYAKRQMALTDIRFLRDRFPLAYGIPHRKPEIPPAIVFENMAMDEMAM